MEKQYRRQNTGPPAAARFCLIAVRPSSRRAQPQMSITHRAEFHPGRGHFARLTSGKSRYALRPYPTWIRTHLHLKTHRPPVGSHPNRFRTAAVARAATVVVGELVSLVARPDAVPYGRCKNLILENDPKNIFRKEVGRTPKCDSKKFPLN